MSRPKRAGLEDCARVSAAIGAGQRVGLGEQTPLEPGLLAGAVSSAKRRVRLVVACLLVIALAPSSALAASGHRVRSSATQKQQQSAHGRQAGAVVLALGSGFSSRESAARVRVVQRRLARAGFAPGPIDGLYGLRTEQAVVRFQAARGLLVDGIAGPLTLAALSRQSMVLYPGAGYAGQGSGRVRVLQRRLARAGFAPGPIDGLYGPRTEQAVVRFQAARGLPVDGIAGPQTLAHLGTQRTPHQITRPRHPAHSHHPANRPSRPGSSPSHSARRQPGRATTLTNAVSASHPTSSPPVGLLALLIALAAALYFAAVWRTGRRSKRGAAAYARHHRVSRIDPADSPNPRGAPSHDPHEPGDAERVFRHALALEEEGSLEPAVAAYQRADQLGHRTAPSNLGLLLEQHGDRAAAEACFRRADQRGDAHGAFNLAALLSEQGDLTGALEAYQRAQQRGHGPIAAAARLAALRLTRQLPGGDVGGHDLVTEREERDR
jgi:peptidoglycan hydrolase-like protein with peptidoglycan-binding domain